MKQIILYLLILPLCLSAQTQQDFFGIIEGAGNRVFFDWDAHDHRREWHSVEYGTETGITKTFPGGNTRKSEVHRSRIRYLADMPQLKRQPQSTDNRLLYANDTLCVEIRLQDFQFSEHVIVKDSLTGFVRSIDGCSELIGTDGNLPQREYASVILWHPAGRLEFPPTYIAHLYEPNPDNIAVAIGKKNTLFISTLNSDGAGGYYAVWTIKDYQVKSLFVLYGF